MLVTRKRLSNSVKFFDQVGQNCLPSLPYHFLGISDVCHWGTALCLIAKKTTRDKVFGVAVATQFDGNEVVGRRLPQRLFVGK